MKNDQALRESILHKLKEKGGRITPVRRAIVEMLCEMKKPLAARDILATLQTGGFKTNKTTVYRQVEDLVRLQALQEVQFGDGLMRYEISHENDHHHHVLCVGCGKVEDVVFQEDLMKHEREIEKKMRYKVLRHSLEFFGKCARCRGKNKQS